MRPLRKVKTSRHFARLTTDVKIPAHNSCGRLCNTFVNDLRIFRIVAESKLPEETLKQGRNASWFCSTHPQDRIEKFYLYLSFSLVQSLYAEYFLLFFIKQLIHHHFRPRYALALKLLLKLQIKLSKINQKSSVSSQQ